MTNKELIDLRYRLYDKVCDLVYILSTKKINFIQKLIIKTALKILAFRIHLIDNKIKVK